MTAALLRRGLTEEHAGYVVDALIEASLRGIDTHGVRLFRTYLAELDGGRSRARPELRWLAPSAPGAPSGATSARTLDAGGALGIVAGRTACAEAARLARQFGVGAVSVRNSNHFGPASYYTLEMARQGVIGFAFTNSDALVAPKNGVAPLFGTNPISIAAAGEEGDLFCADLATSQVSYSKVKHHREHGMPLEPGWAVTKEGEDVASVDGGEVAALQPLGGHKGQCLGMTVEILCALLAGMPLDHELTHLYVEPFDEPRQVAHLFLALDPAAFGAADDATGFRSRLSGFLGLVRSQPAVAGERVVVPGDLERESAETRRAAGIPLGAEDLAWFEAAESTDSGTWISIFVVGEPSQPWPTLNVTTV
jgi:LDH2 family malate/lactate/ureidoglycolate dehydrogenase